MRRSLGIKMLAIVAMLAGVAFAAAPNASAGQLADIRCSLYLTSTPSSPGASSFCATQGFDLAEDFYLMTAQLETQRGALVNGSRGYAYSPNQIPAGHYTRKCGIYQEAGHKYSMGCVLTNTGTNAVWAMRGPVFSISTSGTYQIWGRFESAGLCLPPAC